MARRTNARKISGSGNVPYNPHDTIAAIASANGGAARGIVRISGPATADILGRCFVANTVEDVAAARVPEAWAGSVTLAPSGNKSRSFPCDLYLWPTEKSYTREPVAELHAFGSSALLRAALESVCHAGARLAEPGEFTLRAFLSGRIDLTQAEAVLGVIDAQQTDQLDSALEQLAGNLAQPLSQLRDNLLMLLAELEAGLDFVEEDISFISAEELAARLQAACDQIVAVESQMTDRLTVSSAPQVVLTGLPNAGKSSLFNALVERFGHHTTRNTSAIVSNQSGTTRDCLYATIHFGSGDWELVDTAGVETADESMSSIVSTAQSLAKEHRKRALVQIHCIEATASSVPLESLLTDVLAITKCDLVGHPLPVDAIATSSVTGEGLAELCEAVATRLAAIAISTLGHCVASTSDRCRDSVRLTVAAITRAHGLATANAGDELVAAEIRVALTELGKVVGVVYTDDLLDRIFSTFCIGK
jgi:tRNA modification GTPase